MGKFVSFLLIGVILAILGITNFKGNISSIHWYNRRKVAEIDIPKYGRCIGVGTLIMGLSLIFQQSLKLFSKQPFSIT